jgi:ABC-type dipeptide/oligopeptide/nickel transport system permease subunit
MGALIYLVLVILVAVAAPLVARHEPNFQDLQHRFASFSTDHWLGTDNLGRDTFARVVYGARTSMLITLAVGFITLLVAVPIGLVAGYRSGRIDVLVMRLTDALLAMPPLILALVVAGILGPGTGNLIFALVLVSTPSMIRLVRGQALAIREEGYVDASRAIGTPSRTIMARRIFPHVLSPLLVLLSVMLSGILVFEASLSFLGLGNPPPNASWGAMLKDGFDIMTIDARLMLVPAIAIVLTTLAFNAVGDGLSDALRGGASMKRQRDDRLGTTTIVPRVRPEDVGIPPDAPVAADTVLAIRDLSVAFATPYGPAQVLDDVSIDLKRGEILGLVGESGCGKTAGADHLGGHPLRRARPAADQRARAAQGARARHRHGLPGPDGQPQPGVHHRRPDRRGPARARSERGEVARPTLGRGVARHRRHPRRAAPARRLPAHVLRWHAPARAHRHGARQQPQGAHRG